MGLDQLPKKASTVPTSAKEMTTIFWHSQDVIYIDYEKLELGFHYAELLNLFDRRILRFSNKLYASPGWYHFCHHISLKDI